MVRLFCFTFSDDCFVPDLKVPQNIDEKFSLIKQYLEGMLLVSNIFLTVTSFTTLIMDYFYICLSV